ncbi:hypothetical protein FQN60_018347, partial [Etheostoma spectabile]
FHCLLPFALGTSDPYVKFKVAGKEVFRSKTIHKNLNPVWDERVSLLVETLKDPLYVKVFDYDFGLQDDFMGSAYLHLESLEHQRTMDVTLDLKDPQYPENNLGSLELAVTLSPKEGDVRDAYQSMRLSDVHRKAQLWRGIVSISLIEGCNLQPMDANGLSDPYVKFRMGHQKYKSKTISKTLNPQWREQFDFHMYEEQGGYVDITVWDKDAGKKDDFMGRCTINLSHLSKEHTHKLDLPLEEGEGVLVLLVTLTASAAVSISDLSVNMLDDPQERHQIMQRYSLWRSFNNLKDVGVVQVKVIRAEGLMAADVTGKSDPFCVVELSNDRLQTHTVYKNLNPEWNKVFTFNVKDIHSVLEVTVYDEDRDRSADFLGKVAIPLLNIQNGERKAYALKSKELTGPTKGVIFLEIDVIFNAVKAGLGTLIPIEQKYIEEEPRVSKQLLLQNFNRVRRCIMFLINTGCYINSCFEWDSPQRSICAFLVRRVATGQVDPPCLSPLPWGHLESPQQTLDISSIWLSDTSSASVEARVEAIVGLSGVGFCSPAAASSPHGPCKTRLLLPQGPQASAALPPNKFACLPLVTDVHSRLLPTPSSPGEEPAIWCSKQWGVGCDRSVLVERSRHCRAPITQPGGTETGQGWPLLSLGVRVSFDVLRLKWYMTSLSGMIGMEERSSDGSYSSSSVSSSLAEGPEALRLFVIVVWNFELYMIPLALLLPLAWNYILITSGKDTRQD